MEKNKNQLQNTGQLHCRCKIQQLQIFQIFASKIQFPRNVASLSMTYKISSIIASQFRDS